ncbi:MAG: DegQ family serine endoprotease [Chlorobi bacterium]|nr:DegQ family serine endoprotease [Chlorobiota bacterium]
MTKNRKMFIGLGLVAGIVIGLLISAGFQLPLSISAKAPSAIIDATQKPITNLKEFSQAFSDVAEGILPTVVTILTDRVIKQQVPHISPFGDNDPFREFFGDDFFKRFFPPQGEMHQRALGSGVIVREDGYILTNNHVVRGADKIKVRLFDKEIVEAKIVGTDPKADIAVIKIDKDGLQAAKLGDSDKLRIGEWVLCVGSPLSENLEHTVTAGIISAKGRSNVGLADYEDYIQTDAAINPGNSGGPMLNLNGEVVGINTAIASRTGGYQGIGFAVPSSMAKVIMEQLIEYGKVTRGWLGVRIQNLDDAMVEAMNLPGKDGVLVGEVLKDSPASKAGFKEGDIILTMNGKKVRNVTGLRNRVARTTPGTKVSFGILRDGKNKTLEVTIAELPEDTAAPETEESVMKKLGMTVQTVNRSLAEKYNLPDNMKGVVVTRITRGGVAWEAGIQEGDLIQSVNQEPVFTAGEFRKRLEKAGPGESILFFIHRRDGTLFIAFRMPK